MNTTPEATQQRPTAAYIHRVVNLLLAEIARRALRAELEILRSVKLPGTRQRQD